MEIKNGTERISFGKKKSQDKEIKKLKNNDWIYYIQLRIFWEKKFIKLNFDRNEH